MKKVKEIPNDFMTCYKRLTSDCDFSIYKGKKSGRFPGDYLPFHHEGEKT